MAHRQSLHTPISRKRRKGSIHFQRALEITLGDGAGHNWWCVLYPNMCFRGSVYEVVEDEAKENLKEVLTPDEYESIFDSGKYEIKLKILDIFR